MTQEIAARHLTKKEAKSAKPRIVISVDFHEIPVHSGMERLNLSEALTVLVANWYPEAKAAVKVNLNYHGKGSRA
jgi:hypothetical protein